MALALTSKLSFTYRIAKVDKAKGLSEIRLFAKSLVVSPFQCR